MSVNWNILAVSVRTIDVTGGSSGDNRMACVGAKEIISLISFSGTLWHPVDRFQFDASYKIGQWSNRTGG